MGTVGTLYFLAGLAGYVHSLFANFAVVIVVAASAFFFLFHFFALPFETNWVGRWIWAALLVIVIAEVLLGFLPPTARDELTHHLAIPKLYARAGRIIEVPIAPYAYYPMLLDMLYTPWVYWRYDFVAKHIHALFGFLTGLLIYAYSARRMNSVYGLLGFFFFMSTPAVLRLSHWAYIDLGITFYSTASLLCLLRWRENRDALRWLALSALSLGFALATKPNGLVACLLLSLLFALVLAKPPRKNLRGVACELVLFAVLTLLPFLPWLVKNWLQTGNPFYPLLGRFFAAKTAAVTDAASFVGLGIFERRELLYGENIWQIVGLPLRVFFSGQDDNPQYFDGVLTLVLILFLPWAFRGKWSEEKKLVAIFALFYFLYALFLVDFRIRYILLVVPPLVVLLVYAIFNIYLSIQRPVVLLAGLFIFAAWHGIYLWHYLRIEETFNYLRGSETREDFLTRALPEYSAMQYVNHEVSPAARIYLLFLGRRAYYCERDYFHDAGELPAFLMGAIRAAEDPKEIGRTLKNKNVTHLMVREDLLTRFLSENLTPTQSRLWKRFAATRLKLAFRERGYAVYEIDV
ncbi:MAG: glycosyltransferase family 39 protein [Candidatus Binatia bacterium]